MQLLDGKKTAQDIKDEIRAEVAQMKLEGKKVPHLAAVLVGNDGASLTYVGSKVRSCEQAGIQSTLVRLEDSISEEALLEEIEKLNADFSVDGYIVQLPLPKHINEERILMAVDPNGRIFYDNAGSHTSAHGITNQGGTADGLLASLDFLSDPGLIRGITTT